MPNYFSFIKLYKWQIEQHQKQLSFLEKELITISTILKNNEKNTKKEMQHHLSLINMHFSHNL